VGRIFAEREPRGGLGGRQPLPGRDLKAGDAVDEQGGLAAVGAVQLLGGALEADLREVEAEDGRGAVEEAAASTSPTPTAGAPGPAKR
jgi:hypothetical protein